MPSDSRAAQARQAHRLSISAQATSQQHREVRDHLIRQMREEDPSLWSYQALADAVGCSPELIAHIIKRKR